MESRLRIIDKVFNESNFNLKVIDDFEVKENYITGKIELISDIKPNVLFDVKIEAFYPLKNGNSESISFVNIDLKYAQRALVPILILVKYYLVIKRPILV